MDAIEITKAANDYNKRLKDNYERKFKLGRNT